MKNYILTSLLLMLMAPSVCALEVVYPKQKEVTIKSPKTFFVGNAKVNEPLKINGTIVPVHKSGGFAHVVDLNCGTNEFVVESGNEKQVFKITNLQESLESLSENVSKEVYTSPKYFSTIADNVPLRSTPVDAGINRIAHYPKDFSLKVVGEIGDFYQVELNSEKNAWIAKKDVSQISEYSFANLLKKDSLIDEDFYIFTFEFDRKTPYIIEGGYPFVVKFYNVEGEEDNTLTFSFPLTQKLAGYSGKFEGNTFVLKIRKFPEIVEEKPLKDIKIVIDAGHGGDEIGAIGCLGHLEKDVNLSIAKKLEDELKSRGAKVVMTRTRDTEIGLYERVDIANENNGMIFLSIHGNALPDNMDPIKNNGTSIYYYYPQAKLLADSIIKSMTEQLPLNDDKVRKGSLAVVRNTNALSVLIEVAYLINPEDNSKLINKNIQKNAAKAIADGIEEFLKN